MNNQYSIAHNTYQYIVDSFLFRMFGIKCTIKENVIFLNGIAGTYLSLTPTDEQMSLMGKEENNELTILLITRDRDWLKGDRDRNAIHNPILGGYKGLPGFLVQLIRWYCILNKIPLNIKMYAPAKKFWRGVFGDNLCGDNFTHKSYNHGWDYSALEKLIVLKSLLKAYLLFLYYYLLSKNSAD